MIGRRVLVTGSVAAVAVAAGGAVAWWHRRSEAADVLEQMWAMRFDRPEGGQLALAELRGKPLLINFWATWCAPCIKELPQIERFSVQFAKQGGRVVGLAIDGPTPVREFLARVKLSFAIGLAGLDGTDLVQQLGNPQGALPFSVLINAKGRIVQRKLGETSFDELSEWARAL